MTSKRIQHFNFKIALRTCRGRGLFSPGRRGKTVAAERVSLERRIGRLSWEGQFEVTGVSWEGLVGLAGKDDSGLQGLVGKDWWG